MKVTILSHDFNQSCSSPLKLGLHRPTRVQVDQFICSFSNILITNLFWKRILPEAVVKWYTQKFCHWSMLLIFYIRLLSQMVKNGKSWIKSKLKLGLQVQPSHMFKKSQVQVRSSRRVKPELNNWSLQLQIIEAFVIMKLISHLSMELISSWTL